MRGVWEWRHEKLSRRCGAGPREGYPCGGAGDGASEIDLRYELQAVVMSECFAHVFACAPDVFQTDLELADGIEYVVTKVLTVFVLVAPRHHFVSAGAVCGAVVVSVDETSHLREHVIGEQAVRIVDSDATHEPELFRSFEFAEIIHVGDDVQIHVVEVLDVIGDTFAVDSLIIDVHHVEYAPDTADLHAEAEAGFIFLFQKVAVLDTAGDTRYAGIAVVRPFEFEEEGNRRGTLIYQLGGTAFGHAVDRRFDGGTGTPAVAVHRPGDHAGLDAGQGRRTLEVDGSGNALLIGEQRIVITCHETAPA